MSLSGRSVELLTDGGAFGFALPASHKARWKVCRLVFYQVPTLDETQYSETVTNNDTDAASPGIGVLFVIKGGTKMIAMIDLTEVNEVVVVNTRFTIKTKSRNFTFRDSKVYQAAAWKAEIDARSDSARRGIHWTASISTLHQELLAKVGAPITVRRVGSQGVMADDDLNKLTPAIITQAANVTAEFNKFCPVKKIEYIMNDHLYKQFDEARSQLKKNGRGSREILGFHGTAAQNVIS